MWRVNIYEAEAKGVNWTKVSLPAISYQLSLPARKYYRSTFIYIARLAQVPGVARGIKKNFEEKNFKFWRIWSTSLFIYIYTCMYTYRYGRRALLNKSLFGLKINWLYISICNNHGYIEGLV